jgi:single-stranded DNA-binding protein
VNVVSLIGRVETDPARRDTTAGVVTTFRLAVTHHRHRLWIDVEAWGQLAGTANSHLHRGRRVGVTGALRNKPYTTRDGQRRDHWYVAVNDITFDESPAPVPAAPGTTTTRHAST